VACPLRSREAVGGAGGGGIARVIGGHESIMAFSDLVGNR
jgi:hypothetical protein